MNKLKQIRYVEELKSFIYLHKDTLKKAALPVTVAAAVLFFWVFGIGDKSSEGEDRYERDAYREAYEESRGDDRAGGAGGYGDDGADEKGGENGSMGENSRGGGTSQLSGASSGARLYVDISGCVESPGVYEVEEGTRLFQLIEKAGGLTENADIEGINRAETVSDGQKIIIYAESEEAQRAGGTVNDKERSASNGKININTAGESELQDIPGVGPVTADRIIVYREENGRFSSIEDIKNVSGIGEKTFEKLKDHITV